MDLEKVSAPEFGASLHGIGLNILMRDVNASCAMLETVFDMTSFLRTADFAILQSGGMVMQLHGDHTYHSNPLPSLLPESGPRGAGIEIRLYDVDPGKAEARAAAAGMVVLQSCTDKPHGLRECYLLDRDGYAWVPSRVL
ncbi:glyoxalase [Shimia biformata]|uniref:glyoxalase n=1 Tax=Shimia biformata TaxID=1294299 RepID=UPI00194DF411|nr:glyoxalase [Shimia biformata]